MYEMDEGQQKYRGLGGFNTKLVHFTKSFTTTMDKWTVGIH